MNFEKEVVEEVLSQLFISQILSVISLICILIITIIVVYHVLEGMRNGREAEKNIHNRER